MRSLLLLSSLPLSLSQICAGSYCKCWQTPPTCKASGAVCYLDCPGREGEGGHPPTSPPTSPPGGGRWPDENTERCPEGDEFLEDFSGGLSDARWQLFFKKFGAGNNGLSPHLVSLTDDYVGGDMKKVLRLGTLGDLYSGPLQGVEKVRGGYEFSSSNTRVGSGVCTKQEFASGLFEVTMRVDGLFGNAPSIWTFHYEEHYPAVPTSSISASLLNPSDPLYRPSAMQQSGPGGFYYSTVNSEFNFPELGYDQSYYQGRYTSFRSEIEKNVQTLNIPFINDNRYHKYGLSWRTELVPSSCSRLQTDPRSGKEYCAQAGHEDQGYAMLRNSTHSLAYKGVYGGYFVDDAFVGSVNLGGAGGNFFIPQESAQLCIANWNPDWAGEAHFNQGVTWVSEVKISPYRDAGDVCWQEQSYKGDGLVRPSDYL